MRAGERWSGTTATVELWATGGVTHASGSARWVGDFAPNQNPSTFKTVKAGQAPYAATVDAASNKVYVANIAGDGVKVIDDKGKDAN